MPGGRRSLLSPLSSRLSPGFTLIELLTVISIIGILTSVVAVSLSGARKQARDVRRKTDLTTIQSAVELYANANGGRVPASSPSNGVATSSAAQPWIPDPLNQLRTYVSNLPIDPLGVPNTPPNVYTYQTNPACAANGTPANTIYALDTVLEDEKVANVNLASIPPADPCAAGFAVTGTYAVGTVVHYRVGSGGR